MYEKAMTSDGRSVFIKKVTSTAQAEPVVAAKTIESPSSTSENGDTRGLSAHATEYTQPFDDKYLKFVQQLTDRKPPSSPSAADSDVKLLVEQLRLTNYILAALVVVVLLIALEVRRPRPSVQS